MEPGVQAAGAQAVPDRQRGAGTTKLTIVPINPEQEEERFKRKIASVAADRLNRAVAAAAGSDYDKMTLEDRAYLADECAALVAALTAVGLVLLPVEYVSSVKMGARGTAATAKVEESKLRMAVEAALIEFDRSDDDPVVSIPRGPLESLRAAFEDTRTAVPSIQHIEEG